MMNCRTIIAVLGVGSLLSGCATRQADRSALLAEWQPHIDQPIQQLEETLAALEQQQAMNYTISNVAFLYDAKLYILFHGFVGRLPEAARTSELAEQGRWLTKRKNWIATAYAKYEGGTLASYSAGQASIDATKRRIAQIEKKMKELTTTN